MPYGTNYAAVGEWRNIMTAFIANRRAMEAMLDVCGGVIQNRTGAIAGGPTALQFYGPAHMAGKGGVQFGNRR